MIDTSARTRRKIVAGGLEDQFRSPNDFLIVKNKEERALILPKWKTIKDLYERVSRLTGRHILHRRVKKIYVTRGESASLSLRCD